MERHVVVPSLIRKVCLQLSNSDRMLWKDESKRKGDEVSRKKHIGMEMGLAGGVLAHTGLGFDCQRYIHQDDGPAPYSSLSLRRWRKKDQKLMGILGYVESLKSAQRTSLR